jgi:hypothetical protein
MRRILRLQWGVTAGVLLGAQGRTWDRRQELIAPEDG